MSPLVLAAAFGPSLVAAFLAATSPPRPTLPAVTSSLSVVTLLFLWWGGVEAGLPAGLAAVFLPLSWLAWLHAGGPGAMEQALAGRGALLALAALAAGATVAMAGADAPAGAGGFPASYLPLGVALAAMALHAAPALPRTPAAAALAALPAGFLLAGLPFLLGPGSLLVAVPPAALAWRQRGRGLVALLPALLLAGALVWVARGGLSSPFLPPVGRIIWLTLLGLLAAAGAEFCRLLARRARVAR